MRSAIIKGNIDFQQNPPLHSDYEVGKSFLSGFKVFKIILRSKRHLGGVC
jgi:hypothetical protein